MRTTLSKRKVWEKDDEKLPLHLRRNTQRFTRCISRPGQAGVGVATSVQCVGGWRQERGDLQRTRPSSSTVRSQRHHADRRQRVTWTIQAAEGLRSKLSAPEPQRLWLQGSVALLRWTVISWAEGKPSVHDFYTYTSAIICR